MYNKKFLYVWVLLFGLTWSFCYPAAISASQNNNITVDVRIEGYNRTLASGKVTAYTFMEAVQKLAGESDLAVEFVFKDGRHSIHAIDGHESGFFGGADQWLGYLYRQGTLYMEADLLDKILAEGDELILYYGDFSKTEILSKFTHDIASNGVIFEVGAENMQWTEKNGSWILNREAKPLENVKIHILQPNNYSKILKTDKNGKAATALNQTGVYRYYAELYEENNVPKIVKTRDQFFFYGAGNLDTITRGEAAAFVVNNFSIAAASSNQQFIDLPSDHKYYSQLQTAVTQGILSGYGDGTIKPDDEITLLQFSIMLRKILPDDLLKAWTHVGYIGIPDWAYDDVWYVLQCGVLEGVEKNWDIPISPEVLIQVYKNMIYPIESGLVSIETG